MTPKDFALIFRNPLNRLLDNLSSEIRQYFSNRLLEYQVEEYKRNFFTKTLLHRIEPVDIHSFYQPLYLQKEYGPHFNKRVSTQSVADLFKDDSFLTIIGNAGSGKSTLVKYLFTRCYDERFKIPIKIELRYLNDYNGNFNMYVHDEIFRFNKLGITNDIIDRLLGSDAFVFFFDGYDEVNKVMKLKLTKDIDAFVVRYPGNNYIITSRPYAGIDMFPKFTNFLVTDLDEKEIDSFVQKQIPRDRQEIATRIISAIQEDENANYRTFLSNPLLLSMFILTFQSYSNVPHKKSQFYYQVFDALFSSHDSLSKLSYVHEKLSGLSKGQFEEVLRLFSFISYFDEAFIFSARYLESAFSFIQSKKPHLRFEADDLLADLTVSIGIMTREGLDYSFPHRSLQEYFAASYIANLNFENKKRVYDRLLRMARENFTQMLQRAHFFDLLSELDYNYLARLLVLPLLEATHGELIAVDSQRLERKIVASIHYKSYGVLNVLLNLLKQDEIHSVISQVITERVKYEYVFDSSGNFDYQESRLANTNLGLLEKKTYYFKENGAELIDRIRNYLDGMDQTDNDIIDLI